MLKNVTKSAALMLLALSSGAAMAATQTAQFDVKIQIQASCNAIVQATDLDFGAHDAANTLSGVNATSTIEVKCTKNTPYAISLQPSSTTSTTGAGEMSGSGTNASTKVAYNLYQDASRTVAWGSETAATKQGSGKGLGTSAPADTHTVYGRVPSADVVPDTYTDTVEVTLTY